jgi:hypothetical protein
MRIVEEDETPISKVEVVDKENKFFISDLPSKYRLYPAGTKLYGRPLKVLECKKLTTLNENNYGTIIRDILSKAITGLPVDELLVSDKIYLIFWLRANTYTNANFTIPYVCDACKKTSDYFFGVDSFEVQYLDDSIGEVLELELLESKAKMVFEFQRIKHEDRVRRFLDNMKTSMRKFDEEIVTIASMVKTINGVESTIGQACDYISSLSAEDYAYLHSYILHIDFGISPYIETRCKHCGGTNSVQVNFQPEFFVPKFDFRQHS